jgi:hypothetical protein
LDAFVRARIQARMKQRRVGGASGKPTATASQIQRQTRPAKSVEVWT